jgi:hypothetical protein
MTDWYYGSQSERKGPFTLQQMQHMVVTRVIVPQTMVWGDHMKDWVPLGSLPFMFPQQHPDDAGLNLLLPMGPQSGFSIAAGYCGLIGLLFWLLAPLGILLGILGLRDIAKHPHKKGKGRAITGIVCGTLVVLGFVMVVILSLATRK